MGGLETAAGVASVRSRGSQELGGSDGATKGRRRDCKTSSVRAKYITSANTLILRAKDAFLFWMDLGLGRGFHSLNFFRHLG
jgi:hypothetical protein